VNRTLLGPSQPDSSWSACPGLMITERNWLDVYPYVSWGGNYNLPQFQEGQVFMPAQMRLEEVREDHPSVVNRTHLVLLAHNWGHLDPILVAPSRIHVRRRFWALLAARRRRAGAACNERNGARPRATLRAAWIRGKVPWRVSAARVLGF
jgi:hypothetical protein